jgi:hypothetical protein
MNMTETVKRVDGKWALVSKSDPSKVLQYYDDEGYPSKEWISSAEQRVHSFANEESISTQLIDYFITESKMHTQELARYTARTLSTNKCKKCKHFKRPNKCKIVSGKINPEGTCKYFKLKIVESITEASYKGNFGIMELMRFMSNADPELVKHVKALIKDGRDSEVWKIVQEFTGTRLVGDQFGESIAESIRRLARERK